MGWLKNATKRISNTAKNIAKSPSQVIQASLGIGEPLKQATQQTGDILKSGWEQGVSSFEDKILGKKQDVGKKLGSETQKEYDEQASILKQMEDQFGTYQKGVGETRSKYRADEDAADLSYDELVTRNAGQAGAIESGLADKADALEKEAATQAQDASKVYNESVRPKMMANMENAMTLKEQMDPNNKVQTAYRNLYQQQGDAVRQQGLADYGILAALGGQSAARGMQGRAMTGAQMQGLQQAGLGQAGLAYQRAQQQMDSLRQQGLATGIEQSNRAYEYGQQARSDFTNEEARQLGLGEKSRAERQGYAREAGDYRMRGVEREADINRGRYDRDTGKRTGRYGEDLGDLSMGNEFRQGLLGMKRGDVSAKYGGSKESILAGMTEDQARAAASRGMLTAGMGAGAQAVGSYLGSKAGAKKAAPGEQQNILPEETQGQYGPTSYLSQRNRSSYYG